MTGTCQGDVGRESGTVVTREPDRHAQDDLAIRIFRALYPKFDLLTIGATYVVVPKDTAWFCGVSLGSIARQISEHEVRDGAAQTSACRDVRRRHAASVNVPCAVVTVIA